MNITKATKIRANEVDVVSPSECNEGKQSLFDIVSSASDFLRIYEHYITSAIQYKQERPPFLSWKKIGSNESMIIELVKPENMHSGTYRKLAESFLESRWIYDGIKKSRAGGELERIDVLDCDRENYTLKLSKIPVNKKISVPSQRYVLDRQLDAMCTLLNVPREDYLPIYRLFVNPEKATFPPLKNVRNKKTLNWNLLNKTKDNMKNTEGTGEQRNFVKKALSTPDYAILEGPPGSGKTETICELILQAIEKNQKVMLVAHTHAAVDNVLERIKDYKEVVAVRISAREQKVDETVMEYHISNRRQTEKKRLITYLDAQSQKSIAQKYFSDAIREDDEVTTNLILASANLVCGTTIGILNHPAIKNSDSPPEPLYDLLILDEAGMVTFPEWLVPALYAKRWIFVGDTLQLSPYVDREELAANINYQLINARSSETGLPESRIIKEVCLNCFRSLQSVGLVIHKNRENFNVYKKQANSLDLDLIILDDIKPFPKIKKTNGVLFLSTPESYKEKMDDLGERIRWIRGDIEENLDDMEDNKLLSNDTNVLEKIGDSWEMELSWRMDRIYQLRHYRESDGKSYQIKKAYEEQIENLLPAWNDAFSEKLRRSIYDTCFVPLPSLMDLLQEGYQAYQNSHINALTHGMRKDDFSERHTLLTHQHRSHSAIMRFSREMLYKKKGKDCLKTPKYLDDIRKEEFSYTGYSNPAVWVTYRDQQSAEDEKNNRNPKEAQHLLDHLNKIISWAESHKPPGERERWEFAVLTFYSNQEDYLRKCLSKILNVPGPRIFEKGSNIRVRLATIDTFQGHEADVVLLSLVNTRRVGFLDTVTRLNVALTRARNQMLIFGKKEFFKEQPYSKMLQEIARDENPYYMILEQAGGMFDET